MPLMFFASRCGNVYAKVKINVIIKVGVFENK